MKVNKYSVGDRIHFIDDGTYLDEIGGKYGYVTKVFTSYIEHTILNDDGTYIMNEDAIWVSNNNESGVTLCNSIDIRKNIHKHSM